VVTGGVFADLRMGFFGVGDRPVLSLAANRLVGAAVTRGLLASVSNALSEELDPHEDQQASAAMRCHLAKVLLARCVATLLRRPDLNAKGGVT
jgi:carbon-monoxide dehydrogenase medium subunit